MLSVLSAGDCTLKCTTRRVATTRVVIPLAEAVNIFNTIEDTNIFLCEGRRETDGRNKRSSARMGLTSNMYESSIQMRHACFQNLLISDEQDLKYRVRPSHPVLSKIITQSLPQVITLVT